jgi:hypothetical protein
VTRLLHRSDSLDDAEELESTPARASILTRASVIRLVIASVLTLCAIVGVVINSAMKDPSPAGNSGTPDSANAIPTPPPPAPVTASAPSPFATDDRGFVNTDARCAPTENAVAIGRTEESLVVVCKAADGRLGYKGVRLSLRAGVSVGDVAPSAGGFVARNDVTTYVVTPTELVIRSGDAVATREPMVQYRGPQAVGAPVAPSPPPPAQAVRAPIAPPPPPAPAVAPPPAPQAPAPIQPLSKPVDGYPLLPVTARGTGNGLVRFTANKPWQIMYRVDCPANVAARGSINAGASYMRYHVDLQGGPHAEGMSPARDQSGPILVSITLADQQCGWELSTT